MVVYGFQFIFLLITSIFNMTVKSFRKINIFFMWLILTLPMGLRSSTVGTDTKLYEGIFFSLGKTVNINYDGTIHLFFFWNKLIYYLSQSYDLYTLLTSMLINYLIIKGLLKLLGYRIGASVFLYYILYFYFSSFNITRQYLSMAIVFYGVSSLIYENSNKKFFLSYIASIGIHNTSVFVIIIYLLNKLKWKRNYVLVIVMSIFLIGRLKNQALNIFSILFPHYSLYVGDTSVPTVSEGSRIYLYLYLSSIFFIGLFIESNVQIYLKEKTLIYISSIGLSIGLFFSKDILFGRVEMFFSLFLIVILPIIINKISRKFGKDNLMSAIFIQIIIYSILIVPFIVQLSRGISGVVPYTAWF